MRRLVFIAALALIACGPVGGAKAATTTTPTATPAAATSTATSTPAPAAALPPATLKFTKLGQINAGGPAAESGRSPLWIATERNQLVSFDAFAGATTYKLPGGDVNTPQGITIAPNGTVWVSENNFVVRFDPNAPKPETAAMRIDVNGHPNGRITVGPDQAIWVTELGRDRVARITDNGDVKGYALPPASVQVQCGGRCPFGITAGPDGNIWITESQLGADGSRVGRLTAAGQYQNWLLPAGPLNDIVSGPDGALWVGEGRAAQLGHITTDGQVREFPVALPPHDGTSSLATGYGLIWFAVIQAPGTAGGPVTIGAMSTTGVSRTYSIPGSQGLATAVVPQTNSSGGIYVDVVTATGEIWQATAS